jgi:hypothetical protein
LEQYIVAYPDVIAKCDEESFGSQFIADLVEFLDIRLEENLTLKGPHFLVG